MRDTKARHDFELTTIVDRAAVTAIYVVLVTVIHTCRYEDV